MELTYITFLENHIIKTYEYSFFTYQEILNSLSNNKTIILTINNININYNKLINAKKIRAFTWADFLSKITITDLNNYKSNTPRGEIIYFKDGNRINKYIEVNKDGYNSLLKIIPIEYIKDIIIQEANYKKPHLVKREYLIKKPKDLRVIIPKLFYSDIVNLNNCIFNINGKFLPFKIIDDEYYILNAAKELQEDNGGTFLLDFSNFNNFTIKQFNELNIDYSSIDLDNGFNGKLKIKFNENELVNKTPLLVINGRLILHNKYHYNTSNIELNLNDIPIEAMMISDYGKNKFRPAKLNAVIPYSVQDMITKFWNEEYSFDSFVILVDSKVFVEINNIPRIGLKNLFQSKIFTNQSLLQRNSNLDMVNYVRHQGQLKDYFYFIKPHKEQYLVDRVNNERLYTSYCNEPEEIGINLNEGSFNLIKIKGLNYV